ncbi:hypothetical protein Y919_11525 [Caloranaerobacter azorensis H53214]|uniref:Uncharacterized protein n=1 Tax=Caloranaerobacter azorensis H53214 TaxID=1156417 RepID=A0A096BFQ9_9FIRM|nr:hypothetical protein [Caloranaerobacter azorensis]KGG79523.1 hypothetical protein Y919_11525 [Caloranaerobacter azorensis H53214]
MQKLSLVEFFIFSFPEALIITIFILALCGLKINYFKIVSIGFIVSFSAFLIRPYINSFLLNVFVYDLIMIIVIYLFIKDYLFNIFCSVILTSCIYISVENFNIQIIMYFLKIPAESIIKNMSIRLFAFITQILIMIILFLIVRKFNFTIIDFEDENDI